MQKDDQCFVSYLSDTSALSVFTQFKTHLAFLLPRFDSWELADYQGKSFSGKSDSELWWQLNSGVVVHEKSLSHRYRLRLIFKEGWETWLFALCDEKVPQIHLTRSFIRCSRNLDREKEVGKQTHAMAQAQLLSLAFSYNSCSGNVTACYTFYKLLAYRIAMPSLTHRKLGWEHFCFVEKLQKVLAGIGYPVDRSFALLSRKQRIGEMQNVDRLLSRNGNIQLLTDLLASIEIDCEQWLKEAE